MFVSLSRTVCKHTHTPPSMLVWESPSGKTANYSDQSSDKL